MCKISPKLLWSLIAIIFVTFVIVFVSLVIRGALRDVAVPDIIPDPRKKPPFSVRSTHEKPVKEKMLEVVHIDLKGSPPTKDYLVRFISKLSELGVTGVMIEYEDMFPYEGLLQNISARFAFTKDDMLEILNICKSKNIEIIPMIQTFGKMEHVLKLEEFSELREDNDDWSSICPKTQRSMTVIAEMIRQIMRYHPNSKRIHIGCGKVDTIWRCDRCKAKSRNIDDAFFQHVRNVVKLIEKRYRNVKPLIWDDMVRSKPLEFLMNTNLTDRVEIVYRDTTSREEYDESDVSHESESSYNLTALLEYVKNTVDLLKKWFNEAKTFISDRIGRPNTQIISEDTTSDIEEFEESKQLKLWKKYAKAFKKIWIAGAFRGADGNEVQGANSPLLFPDLRARIENQNVWMKFLRNQSIAESDSLGGYILTGDSKRDHFARSVDLLPTSFPSLALNFLKMKYKLPLLSLPWLKKNEIFQCSFNRTQDDIYDMKLLLDRCSFEESKFMPFILEFERLIPLISKLYATLYEKNNWVSPYHLEKNFYNPLIIKKSFESNNFFRTYHDFFQMQYRIFDEMKSFFTTNVIEEWALQDVEMYHEKLQTLISLYSKIHNIKNCDRRD